MIAIGSDFGGPELRGSPIHLALNTAMKIAVGERDKDYKNGSEAWINPVFLVPGSISSPDFEGFKIGHFSKKEKGLVVQIVVPEAVVNGEDIDQYIVQSLRHAVRLAAEFFKLNGISFSTLKAEKIILAIEVGLETVSARERQCL